MKINLEAEPWKHTDLGHTRKLRDAEANLRSTYEILYRRNQECWEGEIFHIELN